MEFFFYSFSSFFQNTFFREFCKKKILELKKKIKKFSSLEFVAPYN